VRLHPARSLSSGEGRRMNHAGLFFFSGCVFSLWNLFFAFLLQVRGQCRASVEEGGPLPHITGDMYRI
jgi:hypothetical protein